MSTNQPPSLDVETLKARVQGKASVTAPSEFTTSQAKARAEFVELQGRSQFFSLRGKWSWCLVIWITAILLFQGCLTVAVGLKVLDFLQYKWFLPLIIGQSFLQIIGMGVIIVKFLYAHPK